MNKHSPTFEQVQCVADTFYMIADTVNDEYAVHMDVCKVPRGENICGTQACHAGWWLYFARLRNVAKEVRFDTGADLIAQALGFEGRFSLGDWTFDNPDIWGNDRGYEMFCMGDAFGKVSNRLSLKTIADHWQQVAINVGKRESGLL